MPLKRHSWIEPVLVKLIRNRSEESVLDVCKSGVAGSSNHIADGQCLTPACGSCQLVQPS